ncbi:MAG: NAD(P)/FAD-dependent oxidoreductase [Pseudomonadota bacterium]
MADKSFDVVIVGGGNKSLVAAMYLTKFGKLSVGIFEERHELGGGWCSEECEPGFMSNVCSHAHYGFYHIPVEEDIPEWRTYGAKLRYCKVSGGVIFSEDDTCVALYSKNYDPTMEKTAREFAKFSQRDADTWLWLWDKYKKYWEPAFHEWLWNPAVPLGEEDAMDRLIKNPDAGIDPMWLVYSPIRVLKDLFESLELRCAFERDLQSLGIQNDQDGMGWGALIILFLVWTDSCHVVGGTHQLAHASQRVIYENGGRGFTKHPVEKVLIENGKAIGIRLEDGTEIEAKKAVLTSLDPEQTFFKMIGKEYLDRKLIRRIENLERDWINITWYTWALRERPKYKAESFCPDIWTCEWLALGDKDIDTFRRESSERKAHIWPTKTNLSVGYHYIDEDSMLCPEGYQLAHTEQYVLPAYALTDKEWKEREKYHAEDVIRTWQKYAPNMTWDNVIAYHPVTPYYTANMQRNFAPAGNWCVVDATLSQLGKYRPTPEVAGHKLTGIKNFYCTGTAWHPFGCAQSAQGYNVYKVMAEDLGLAKPWKDKGRPW